MHITSAARAIRVMAILTIVIPVSLFAITGWVSWDREFAAARTELMQAAAVSREHAIKVFETTEVVADHIGEIVLGRSDEAVRADEPAIHQRLKALSNRFEQILDILVISGSGGLLASGSSFPVPDLDASNQDYLRYFRDSKLDKSRTYISQVSRERATDQPFFQIARMRPEAAPDSFNGVTVISVASLYFTKFYREAAANRFAAMGLTRADGTLLARHPSTTTPLEQVPLSENFRRIVHDQPEQGIIEAVSPLVGVERLNAYRRLPNHPVYVTVSIDRSAIVGEWRAAMAQHLIFGLPATLALLALSLLALRFTKQGNKTLKQLRLEVTRREAAEAQFRQAQKMEAVGRLTGGIAHDFNNLLTIVGGNIELLQRRLTNPEPRVVRAIDTALEGLARAAKLTHRLLAFSRQQPLEPVNVDVHKLIVGMSDLLRRALGETISLEIVLAGSLWRTHIDPNQLENTVLNLVLNARDAMPEGGKITIETSNIRLDDAYAAANDQVTPGQYVMVAVSDTGTGMTPEVMAKAFDPFFTTKPIGIGTGLGLSQVYGFIKQSEGHVKIYSEVGHGTTIKLYLPRLQGDTDRAEEPAIEQPSQVARTVPNQTVLVVEDDLLVRRFSVEVLEEAGYRVLAAEDGLRGLALLKEHPDIRMLFTDVVLGGEMNGRKLADEAVKVRPNLSVLFTTGYTHNAIVHHGRLDEGINFIGKPFTAAALIAKVEQILTK